MTTKIKYPDVPKPTKYPTPKAFEQLTVQSKEILDAYKELYKAKVVPLDGQSMLRQELESFGFVKGAKVHHFATNAEFIVENPIIFSHQGEHGLSACIGLYIIWTVKAGLQARVKTDKKK